MEYILITKKISMNILSDEFRSRFWRKVLIRSENECWTWIGSEKSNGYGVFTYLGKNYLAHRVAYFLYNNGAMDQTMLVCHTCDNPWCVNPKHLWEGTSKDNSQDMVLKKRGRGGGKYGVKSY